MTNLDFIKTLNAEELVNFIFNKTNYMCLQHGNYNKEIWQMHCLGKYGSDKEEGCKKCRIDWLNSEVGTIKNQLTEMAKKRQGE